MHRQNVILAPDAPALTLAALAWLAEGSGLSIAVTDTIGPFQENPR